MLFLFFFFFNDTATTEIYTLSLHDALPISGEHGLCRHGLRRNRAEAVRFWSRRSVADSFSVGGGSSEETAAPCAEDHLAAAHARRASAEAPAGTAARDRRAGLGGYRLAEQPIAGSDAAGETAVKAVRTQSARRLAPGRCRLVTRARRSARERCDGPHARRQGNAAGAGEAPRVPLEGRRERMGRRARLRRQSQLRRQDAGARAL